MAFKIVSDNLVSNFRYYRSTLKSVRKNGLIDKDSAEFILLLLDYDRFLDAITEAVDFLFSNDMLTVSEKKLFAFKLILKLREFGDISPTEFLKLEKSIGEIFKEVD